MYQVLVQRIAKTDFSPETAFIKKCAKNALKPFIASAELTIRIVDRAEIQSLNHTYRKKDYATNVLSFPFETPDGVNLELPLLGDIIICASVVNDEALAQAKSPALHWAHMIVHGVLHLLGYDHEQDEQAEQMEEEEISILKTLGFDNPYLSK